MSFKNEILKALLEASLTAESAGEYRLADHSDILAMRVAQVSKKDAIKGLVSNLGFDQAASMGLNKLDDTADGLLKGAPVGDTKQYITDYATNPSAWLLDLIPATNRLRFLNMIRSELISVGFTELTDNRIWQVFSQQKGQNGLEALIRDISPGQADRLLGPMKNTVDAGRWYTKMSQWIRNIPSNKVIGWRRMLIRNFGSLVPDKGGFATNSERAQRVQEYAKSKDIQNARKDFKTEDFIKEHRRNLDDVGFDRSKLDAQAPKGPKTSPVKGIASTTSKITSSADFIKTVNNSLKNNNALLQSSLKQAGETKEGAQWIKFLKSGTKDASKMGRALKALGKIAVVFAVYDIINTLPAAMQGDVRAQVDVLINSAGFGFPPIAIANGIASLFGIQLSDLLVTSAESLGEMASGVDVSETNSELINSGMTYNPQTKEWTGGGASRSYDSTGKSFEAEMMNMVKSGMSINQAWLITLKKMKDSGASPESILTARQKYNQAKTMIYETGKIGNMPVPVWDEKQIDSFVDSLTNHVVSKLNSGTPYEDLIRIIDVYMRKVPNLKIIQQVKDKVVLNLDAARKDPVRDQVNTTRTENKRDDSLMSMNRKSRGASVAAWQQFLAKNGFFKDYTSKTPPVFGPRTTRATRAFQSKYNLRVDGIVGPETLGKARQLGGKL